MNGLPWLSFAKLPEFYVHSAIQLRTGYGFVNVVDSIVTDEYLYTKRASGV